MGVVSHGYGSLGEGWDGAIGLYAGGKNPVQLIAYREMPEHFLSVR